MSSAAPDAPLTFPRVRDDFQVHLRARGGGLLVDARRGEEEAVGRPVALALRMMTGERPYAAMASGYAAQSGMDVSDAGTALAEIVAQFTREGIVELHDVRQTPRTFSPPLESPYQLRVIQLQLTNKCNLTCPHCYARSGARAARELSLDSKLALIDAFADLGGVRLFLTGGETLLDRDLRAVIAHAKSRHLFVYLSTNGFGVNERAAARLTGLGVGAVNVSIDGAHAETHDAFRGRKGAYDQAVRALRAFIQAGAACASHTTLTKANLGQSVEISRQMRALGARASYFVRMLPQGRALEHQELIPTMEEYAAEREAELRARPRGPGGLAPSSPPPAQTARCSAARSQIYVRADGACFPCPSLEDDTLAMGVFPDRPLVEIWRGGNADVEAMRRFEPRTIAECRDCRHQKQCRGGCAGNSLHLYGDWRRADPHLCVLMGIRERLDAEIAQSSSRASPGPRLL